MKITTRLVLAFLVVSILPLAMVSYIGWRALNRVSSLALDESTAALKRLGETSIHQKALDVARQVDLYLEAQPELLTLPSERLKADEALAAIAVQPVGETGYTAVYDSGGVTHFHVNPDIVGVDLHELADALPAFWAILEASLDGTTASGYYEWQDADGTIRDKYMSCVPVGDTHLRVAATTYIDEFYQPIRDTEAEITGISQETQLHMRVAISVVGVVAMLVAVLLATLTIRPLNRIAEGARLFSQGKLDHRVPDGARDEVGQLATTFNQMARELAKTLQEKDDVAQQLHDLNQRLEQMVAERTAELEASNRDLEARQRELLTLQEVSQQISSLLSLESVLERMVDSVVRAFGYGAVAFFLVDEATNEVYPVAQSGLDQHFLKRGRLKVGQEGLTGHVAASGEPLLLADVSEDPRYIPGAGGIKSGMYVPLLIGQRVIGVLNVQSKEYNAFSTHDLEIMTALANQAAVFIENARLFQSVQEQALDLANMADSLAEERSKLDAILKNIADGLIATDPWDTILLVNPAFEGLFGQPAAALVGRPLTEAITEKELHRLIASALENQESTFVADIPLPDGRTLKASSAAIQEGERTIGVVTVLRDITHEREVDRMKTDFISTVSHELRTPLTSVLGFAKLISKAFEKDVASKIPTGDRKGQRAVRRISDNLDIIVNEGERLTRLINDVLDIAKMEAGKIEWHMADVSLDEVIRNAVAATSALAEAKHLPVRVEVEEDLPPVWADRDRLIQVVTNLLSNAIKFTDGGQILVRARQVEVLADGTIDDQWVSGQSLEPGEWLAVSVQDSGIGIAREHWPRVFEKFKQVGDAMTNRPKGTGLGLPISREIVEHHGGHIWVESELGVGSTFTFVLPLAPIGVDVLTEPQERPPMLDEIRRRVSEALPVTQKTGQLILVVDDEENIRELLRQELTEAGYRVVEAADGVEALTRARQERPDLIVLDVMMPGISGFDVASALRGDPTTADIPILILSIIEDRERGARLGVDEYLTKPLDAAKLLQSVATLLTRAERGEGHKKVLVIEDDASVIETITRVLHERGYEVVEAHNGHDGLEKARQERPDLIILNALIFQMNDYEVLRALRYETGTRDASVILLTATTSPEKAIELLEQGADRTGASGALPGG